ncbi:redoxin domain-containing protein [Halogeometricum limi]|uniref:Peroxiredoxin n=1 Tax=Halogeometricum limi TaxID=555875 RepID=A0A1I6FWP6_9EURY|nr:redoxin domain-containing protein [Halogeometricum limi]SFR34344.1 Peroxiredoxin [Halogeometricum limi]
MLRLGDEAPTFSLPGTAGDDADEHSLSEYTDNGWHVVLVFYPFDFHPACIAQWCALRDADWLSLLDDTVVLGVGGDSVYAHGEFARAYNVEFPLLSDSDGDVAAAYGVREDEFEGHRDVPGMALFVVDPGRRIRFAWRGGAADAEPDFDAVREVLGHSGDGRGRSSDDTESADA